MTVTTSPRCCDSCSHGVDLTVNKGVGVPAGYIGGELTIPVTIRWCHKREREVDLGDSCPQWRYDAHED